MPIYEYRCKACRHQLEAIQAFSDAPLTECPECQGQLQRLISNSAVHFKGSGWYITDYARKEKAAQAASSGDSSEAKSEPAKDSSNEAKPAPATGSKSDAA